MPQNSVKNKAKRDNQIKHSDKVQDKLNCPNKQFAAITMGFETQLEPKVGTQPKQDLFSTGDRPIASNSTSNREASPR